MYAHSCMHSFSSEHEKFTKRKYYITPKLYLDFLTNFTKVYEDNFKKTNQTIQRYQDGLNKLVESSETINVLKEQIEEEKILVEIEKKDVEELL